MALDLPAESSTPPSAPPRPTPEQLQAEVAAAREALLASVQEIKAQFTPGALAARGGRAIGGWFTKPDGGLRPDRVAIAGAVVVGLVALTAVSSAVRRRRG